jgi:hypothetical protein
MHISSSLFDSKTNMASNSGDGAPHYAYAVYFNTQAPPFQAAGGGGCEQV